MESELADRVSLDAFWTRFWRAMDRGDYDAVIEALTDDCRWLRSGWCEGRTAIRASLEQRPDTLFSRHLVCNLLVERNPEGYSCEYALLIFGAHRPSPEARPPFVTTGPRMADYRARLVLQDNAWKVAEIRPELLFERP